MPTVSSFNHQQYKDDASVIAFAGLTGSFARFKSPPQMIPPAPSDSLESRAFSDVVTQERYFNSADLRGAGMAVARPLDYSAASVADWSSVLDGYFLFREENPPHFKALK